MGALVLGNTVDDGGLKLLVELKGQVLSVYGGAELLEDGFRSFSLISGDDDLEVGGVFERFLTGSRLFGNKEFHLGVEGDPGLGVGLGDLNEGVKAAGHEEYLEAGEELPGGSSIRLGNLSGQDGCPALFSVEVCGVGGEGNRDVGECSLYRAS